MHLAVTTRRPSSKVCTDACVGQDHICIQVMWYQSVLQSDSHSSRLFSKVKKGCHVIPEHQARKLSWVSFSVKSWVCHWQVSEIWTAVPDHRILSRKDRILGTKHAFHSEHWSHETLTLFCGPFHLIWNLLITFLCLCHFFLFYSAILTFIVSYINTPGCFSFLF
jgi:hypothetical protein